MRELSGTPTAPDAPEIIQRPVAGALRPGHVIAGRYEIQRRLGTGGMGAVYRVHDRVLDEDVALKVILPAALGDPAAIERLRDEVKIARKITHPNVCRVFDLGEDEALTFLTMELVEGNTLRQELAAGPIEPARALELLQQIVSGVAAAHEKGVIHRDLKPENVLVRSDGRCVVADFGLARDPGAGIATIVGVAGTPGYMSPEQRRGEPIDVRSDVFALGIMGLELVTGPSPVVDVCETTVSLSSVRRVPGPCEAPSFDAPGMAAPTALALRDLLARALAERPEERFASAAELGSALALARSAGERAAVRGTDKGDEVAPQDPRPMRRAAVRMRWGLTLATVAAVAALAVAGGVRLRATDAPLADEPGEQKPAAAAAPLAPREADRAAIAVLPFENLTGEATWNGLCQSAPEAIRAGLRTMPDVALALGASSDQDAMRAAGIVFLVRGNVQRLGGSLRLFAQIDAGLVPGDALPSEPVEIDVNGTEIAPALETLRRRLLDEARIVVARHRRWQRASLGTTSPAARENLLAYYRMIGPAPRSEHFEPGLRLLDEALTADPAYVPARVERAFLLAVGAGAGTDVERYGRALGELDSAQRARPDDRETIVLRCRLTQGLVEREDSPRDTMIERATEACQAALTAAPSSAHVHIMMARLYDRRCDDERAMRALARAVELDRSLSGRAFAQIVNLAQDNGQLLVADRASSELVAFQQEEERLGPRALGRRSGAPEIRGAYLARGGVLLALERLAEAKEAFSHELAVIAESHGRPHEEATALRGLLRVAAADQQGVPRALVERLEAIEASYRARLATKPSDVQFLAQIYRPIDPDAAADWIDRLAPAQSCEDAFQRARVYLAASRGERARATLASCSPTQDWERSCIAQLVPRGIKR
jgi:serine/threonine-protein kinase